MTSNFSTAYLRRPFTMSPNAVSARTDTVDRVNPLGVFMLKLSIDRERYGGRQMFPFCEPAGPCASHI
jgi:hypothetical protein